MNTILTFIFLFLINMSITQIIIAAGRTFWNRKRHLPVLECIRFENANEFRAYSKINPEIKHVYEIRREASVLEDHENEGNCFVKYQEVSKDEIKKILKSEPVFLFEFKGYEGKSIKLLHVGMKEGGLFDIDYTVIPVNIKENDQCRLICRESSQISYISLKCDNKHLWYKLRDGKNLIYPKFKRTHRRKTAK